RTTRSRCLFGSGIASGKDRAAKALRAALASPLLDQGSLLKDAQTVIVHLCGGEDLTLFEVELLMQNLGKHVPDKAHVLFGAAIDPAMGESLSITLISALPEDTLAMAPRDSLSRASDDDNPLLNPSQGFTPAAATKVPVVEAKPAAAAAPVEEKPVAVTPPAAPVSNPPVEPAKPPVPPAQSTAVAATPALFDDEAPFAETSPAPSSKNDDDRNFGFTESAKPESGTKPSVMVAEFVAVPHEDEEEMEKIPAAKPVDASVADDDAVDSWDDDDPDLDEPDLEAAGFSTLPPKRPPGATPWTVSNGPKTAEPESAQIPKTAERDSDAPKLKLGVKTGGAQSELSLDATPRGRFEGESPNVYEGEDLDLPPFLRKKK
ncbi:MAG TPA: hypothetical protein VLO11_15425, partial [Luteolibacter sp.]|nr:hypothetical protein [Luteolibacter sp.]